MENAGSTNVHKLKCSADVCIAGKAYLLVLMAVKGRVSLFQCCQKSVSRF